MPLRPPILPPEGFGPDCPVIGDRDEIRRFVPQRDTFEMLHGILHYDPSGVAVAYRDVRDDEHWVSGHIPGMPLFPGVLMIETAAQLCCYLFHKVKQDGRFFAFGGVDSVRFRGTVEPGDRIVIMTKTRRIRRHLGQFETQAFVGSQMVYEGIVTGMVLASHRERSAQA